MTKSASPPPLQGDVLMRIGKENVYRAPAPHVADLLLGPPGSELEVTKTARSRHPCLGPTTLCPREAEA
jgi:hypothetical protein